MGHTHINKDSTIFPLVTQRKMLFIEIMIVNEKSYHTRKYYNVFKCFYDFLKEYNDYLFKR